MLSNKIYKFLINEMEKDRIFIHTSEKSFLLISVSRINSCLEMYDFILLEISILGNLTLPADKRDLTTKYKKLKEMRILKILSM